MKMKNELYNLRRVSSLYIYSGENGPNLIDHEYNKNIGTRYKGSNKESNREVEKNCREEI